MLILQGGRAHPLFVFSHLSPALRPPESRLGIDLYLPILRYGSDP